MTKAQIIALLTAAGITATSSMTLPQLTQLAADNNIPLTPPETPPPADPIFKARVIKCPADGINGCAAAPGTIIRIRKSKGDWHAGNGNLALIEPA